MVLDGYDLDPRTGAALRAAGVTRAGDLRRPLRGAARRPTSSSTRTSGRPRTRARGRHCPRRPRLRALPRPGPASIGARRAPPVPIASPPRVLTVFGGTDAYAAGPVVVPLLFATGRPVHVIAVAARPEIAERLRAIVPGPGQTLEVLSPVPDLAALAVGVRPRGHRRRARRSGSSSASACRQPSSASPTTRSWATRRWRPVESPCPWASSQRCATTRRHARPPPRLSEGSSTTRRRCEPWPSAARPSSTVEDVSGSPTPSRTISPTALEGEVLPRPGERRAAHPRRHTVPPQLLAPAGQGHADDRRDAAHRARRSTRRPERARGRRGDQRRAVRPADRRPPGLGGHRRGPWVARRRARTVRRGDQGPRTHRPGRAPHRRQPARRCGPRRRAHRGRRHARGTPTGGSTSTGCPRASVRRSSAWVHCGMPRSRRRPPTTAST